MKISNEEEAVVSIYLYREFRMKFLEKCFELYFATKEKYPYNTIIQKNFVLHSKIPIGLDLENRFFFANMKTRETLIDDCFEFIRIDLARNHPKQNEFTSFLIFIEEMCKDEKNERYDDNILLLKALQKFKKKQKNKNKGGK